MQLLLNSSRALAGVVAALLVAGMLSVLTIGAASAADPEKVTVTVTAPDEVSELVGEVTLVRWSDAVQAFRVLGRRTVEAGASNATVDFEVTPGTYFAHYQSWTPDVVSPAYSGGVRTRPRLPSDPGTFTVTAGTDVATTIPLTERASLSGSLTNPDGTPVENTDGWFSVFPADAGPSETRSAHDEEIADGAFRMNVDPGSWRLKFQSWNDDFLDHTYEDVTVAPGEHLTLPAVQLKRAPTTLVPGTVTLKGVPRADVEVYLMRVSGTGGWEYVNTTTTTDSNGEYAFHLRDDRTYTVWVQGKGIIRTFLGGSIDRKEANTFTTAAGSRLPTIDTLPSATLSGVLLADGRPVRGEVFVYSVPWSGPLPYAGYAKTDEDGKWSREVPFGNYVIKAEPSDIPFLTTHLGSQYAEEIEAAGTFRVEAGERVTKDVHLLPVPMLVGSVVSVDGSPLAGASVEAFMWDETKKIWERISEDRTDPDGTYSLPVRNNKRLDLRFTKDFFLGKHLGGGLDSQATPTDANSITTKGRTTSVPTVSLVPEGWNPPPTPTPPKLKATVRVKGTLKVRADERAALRVRVGVSTKNHWTDATGHVVVKMSAKGKVKGKKVRTVWVKLRKGRAVLRLPKLARGKWAVKVAYQGNAKTKKASRTYALKVTSAKKKRRR